MMTTPHFYADYDSVRAAIAADELTRQKPRASVFTGRIVYFTEDGRRAVSLRRPFCVRVAK